MVPEILTHSRSVLDQRNTLTLQRRCRSYTGEQQKVGRGDCSSGQYEQIGFGSELLAAAVYQNPSGPLALE